MDFTVKEDDDWRETLKKRFAKPWEKPTEKKPAVPSGVMDSLIESGWDCIETSKVLKGKVENADKLKKKYNDVIVRTAKKAMKEDMKMLDEARTILLKLEELTGSTFKRKIRDMFIVGFKGSGSRNTLLFTPEDCGYKCPKIVIGPEGFQMRPYVQARPMGNFEEIQFIVNHKAEIIKVMKSKRNLKKSVAKFEKFCELMPEIVQGNQSLISIGKEVLVPRESDYRSSLPFKVINKMCFMSQQSFGVIEKGDKNEHRSHIRYDDYADWDDAVAYLQMRDMIPDALAKLKLTAMPAIESAEDAIEKIQDLFGRELLFNNL